MDRATDTIRLGDAQTLVLLESTDDRLQLRSTWEPTASPPPQHWHPQQDEHFEVLSGRLTVELDDDRQTLSAGQCLDVPARTAHRMWNAGPAPSTATWTITPALRTEQLFRFMDRGTGGLRGPVMLLRFRHEFRLGRPRS